MSSLLDRYEEAIRRLPVTATSPDGWVSVHRDESGEVTVRLRSGALHRLTEPGLAAELQAALSNAYRMYREECRQQRRKIFGSDFDLIHARDQG